MSGPPPRCAVCVRCATMGATVVAGSDGAAELLPKRFELLSMLALVELLFGKFASSTWAPAYIPQKP